MIYLGIEDDIILDPKCLQAIETERGNMKLSAKVGKREIWEEINGGKKPVLAVWL